MADGTELAKAYVQIIPSAQGIQGKITSALGGEADAAGVKAGNGFSRAFGGALKGIGTVATAAFSAAATAAGAAAKGVIDTAAIGDNIDKMSQKMGLSAQAYQEWDAIMQHSGTSIDAMQSSMKTLANAVENGNKAFEELGISQEEIANMSNEDLFATTITALQNVDSETRRTYLAGQLLGRGATELGALLNTSAEDTEAMRQRVHELGGVMSDEAVKSAAGFQDSLQDMKTAISGIGRGIASEMLPGVKSVIDGLTELFAGDSDKGINMIQTGVSNLLEKLGEKLPEFLKIGSGILTAISKAIIENLPEIVRVGTDILISLVETLTEDDNIDSILDAAVNIILVIADALIKNIDKVINAVLKIITALITKLTEPETVEALIAAAFDLMIAIVKGELQSIPYILEALAKVAENILTTIGDWEKSLVEKGKQIIDAIGKGVKEAADNALQWGKDLIDNFIAGIGQGWDSLKRTVSNLAQTVKDYLGFSEPELGPLSDFHTYAPDMLALFAKGIQDNAQLITDSVSSAFDVGRQLMSAATSNVGAALSPRSEQAAAAGAAELPPIYVTVTYDGSDQTLIRALAPQIEARFAQRGNTF